MAGNRVIEFEEEGVIFIIPQELDKVHIRREKIEDRDNVDGPVLDPRTVMRVSILNTEGKDLSEEASILDANITLIVYYNYDDLVRAKKNREDEQPKPILRIGEGSTLREFNGKEAVYRKVSGNKNWLGYVVVKMDRSGDPPINWGP